MSQSQESFKAALAADLLCVYEEGLAEDIEPATVPVLAELAEAINRTRYAGEKDYYCLQIESLLRRAIARRETTIKRREGLERLFGIQGERVPGLEARREAAADAFGYSSADSLRKGKENKRPFEMVLREDLVGHMLALAAEAGFAYTGRYERKSPGSTAAPSMRLKHRWFVASGAVALFAAATVLVLVAENGHGSSHRHARVASLAVPVTIAPFSPNRQTYDYDVYDPSNSNCDDPSNPGRHFGRCGALTGHVLNSFINTPSYGDERAFFDARLSTQSTYSTADPLTGVKVGDTVVLRVYVDNDTAVNPTDSGASDTRNTHVRINLAHTVVDELAADEWVLQPQAFISASNAQTVEDGVNLVGSEPFALVYEPGSAKLLRNNVSYALSDEIAGSEGALIGLLYMNGDLPAGDNFDGAALVKLRARVVAVAPPEIRIANQVRLSGSSQWHSKVYATPGGNIQWLLNTENGPWSTVSNVVTRDVLPPNLEVESGSVALTNARGGDPLADGPLFGGGYNAGTYNPRDNTLITFKTKVLGNFTGCQVIDRNEGFARSDQTPVEVTNDADVIITKPNCVK